MSCVFCQKKQRVFKDNYPVTPGHTLVIPIKCVSSPLDLTPGDWVVLLTDAKEATAALKKEDPSIEGFNIGFNIGQAAGQSVDHCHMHIIPRRSGDTEEDSFGGIRNIIKGKGKY